ncbi:hypothetical protein DPM19_09360 [Actinomadura craniellae]|uniref:CBS domain-containing protein n=1 Tax=Actinomadura craniellae TaxID=2231787 RepID=A0A365HAJ2_9ACTN|nr:CBS domain-containing protein [Actinomadura craniellae]RAY15946.1 hypothetical protein DPM19_09360 [Actinomadura craniellae]
MTPEEFLTDAAGRGAADPMKITVRDLLAIWGYATRTSKAVADIGSDLAQAGLTTSPPFDGIRDVREPVTVAPLAPQAEAEDETGDEPPDIEDRFPAVSLCVEELPSASAGVLSVGINEPLQRAQTLMMDSDYSQLAVLDGSLLRGAISWSSISAARIAGFDGSLRGALMPESPAVLHPKDKLLDKIEHINERGFAFVADTAGLRGIVTTADISLQFARLTGPFLLISEIERRIRRQIEKVCPDLTELQAAASQSAKKPADVDSVHELTFFQAMLVLEKEHIWKRLQWDLDRGYFVERLRAVKTIRNEVMHFRPTPVSAEQAATLTKFANWLRWLDHQP